MKHHFNEKEIRKKLDELGDFYHNIELPYGIETKPGSVSPARGQNWEKILKVIPQDLTGKTVLDLGCNAGAFSFELAKRNASKVVGVEFDKKYYDQAIYINKILDLNVIFHLSSVENFLKDCNQFDYIVCVGLLYHVHNPLSIAKAIYQKTKIKAIIETYGTKPHLRNLEEAILELPYAIDENHAVTTMNMVALKHIFTREGFRFESELFEGGRLGVSFLKN